MRWIPLVLVMLGIMYAPMFLLNGSWGFRFLVGTGVVLTSAAICGAIGLAVVFATG